MSRAVHAAVHWKSTIGVRKRPGAHDGHITIRSELPSVAQVSLRSIHHHRREIASLEIQPWEQREVAVAASPDFDFMLVVNGRAAQAHAVRGASYLLRPSLEKCDCKLNKRGQVSVELLSGPTRRKTDRLTSTPGLTFSFSGSGFLCVYQFGAAQCLQDQGICVNPYVRVAGVSGGVSAVVAMMYGASMRDAFESVKDMAVRVRRNPKEFVKMRRQMMTCLANFWRDGSVEHPAFKDGRVEVCFSETNSRSIMWMDSVTGSAKQKRVGHFKDSAQVAMMMIASASVYFSGLPFILQEDETGQAKKVGDGGLVDNLPVFDDHTITLKPFTDGFDVMHLTGRTPDIAPSEFVPVNYAIYPPDPVMLEHLFELGYRDTEAWLDAHLEERMAQIRAASSDAVEADLPPVEFTCPDEGMAWYDEVFAALPMRVRDQVRQRPRKEPARCKCHDEDASTGASSTETGSAPASTSEGSGSEEERALSAQGSLAVLEGWLELTGSALPQGRRDAMPLTARRWCTVDSVNISWAKSPESASELEGVDAPSCQAAPGDMSVAPNGKLPLAWVRSVSRCPEKQNEFSIDMADGTCLACAADSADDAALWMKKLRSAGGEFYRKVSRVSL